jgi:hypothetical protein
MRFIIFFILLFFSYFSFSQGVKLDIDFNDKGKQFDKNGDLEFEGLWEKDKCLNN